MFTDKWYIQRDCIQRDSTVMKRVSRVNKEEHGTKVETVWFSSGTVYLHIYENGVVYNDFKFTSVYSEQR